jgi:hypothetical protein
MGVWLNEENLICGVEACIDIEAADLAENGLDI